MITVSDRTLRWTWAGLPALFAIRMVLAASGIDIRYEALWSDVLTYLLPLALAVIGCVVLSKRLLNTLEHWLWGAMALACAGVFAGEAYFSWYVFNVDFHGTPMGSPVRLVFLGAVLLYLATVLRMTRFREQPIATRVRAYADALSAAAIVFSLVYFGWTLPAYQQYAERVQLAWQSALYPVVALVLVGSILTVITGWRPHRWSSWERLIVAAHAALGAGLIAIPVLYPVLLATTEQTSDFSSTILGSGMYLLFMACLHRAADPRKGLLEPHPMPRRLPRLWNAYPAIASLGLPLGVWQAHELAGSHEQLPVAIALIVLALALATRSWVSAIELTYHRHRAVTDPLTGVHNAPFLRRRLPDILRHAAAHGSQVALVTADVDTFRFINNSYGHEAGDRVLRAVASAMLAHATSRAEVFRLASDEFAAVLPDRSRADALAFGDAVRRDVQRACTPSATVSVGVALYPDDATSSETLIGCASIAERWASRGDTLPVAAYDSDLMAVPGGLEAPTGARSRTLRDAVRALASAVDARQPETRQHSANVSVIAGQLGQGLGLSEHKVRLIELGALVHDVGKVGADEDTACAKRGHALSDQCHCTLGERIVAAAGLTELTPLVRHHHERWDGTGCPDGLAAHDIPLEARIIAICDAYETSISGRPGQAPCSMESALVQVGSEAGKRFDPMVTATFIAMLQAMPEENDDDEPEDLATAAS